MNSRDSAPRRGGMVRNFLHLGLGQVSTTLLAILLNAALGRVLNPTEFGQYILLMSIATFVYVVVDWGHCALIIRETSRHPDRAGDLHGTALAVRTVSLLTACPIAVAITWVLGYDLTTRLLTGALVLALLPQYLGLSFGWIFRGYERMDLDALQSVIHRLGMLVVSIACLALGGRLPALVIAWSLAGSLTFVVGVAMYRKLRLPALAVTMSTGRELLREGAPIFAMTLTVAIEPFVNANILYKMCSPAVVGWYGVAMNIGGTLIAPATILAMTMYPRLSMVSRDGAEFRRVFETSFRPLLLLAVLGVVGTYLFSDIAVGIIYSMPKFAPAADNLRAFAPVLLLMYVDILLGTAILAAGKSSRLAIIKITSIVITTGLALVLVPIFQSRFDNGGLGVMYAMVIGESIMLVAAVSLIREVIGSRAIGDFFRSLAAGAATVLLFQKLPTLNAFIAIPACVLLFAVMALAFGAAKWSDFAMLSKKFRTRKAAGRG